MKKTFFVCAGLCIVAACDEGKAPGAKVEVKAVKAEKAKPRGEVTITGAQPTGTLTSVPDRIVFAASGPVQDEQGTWLAQGEVSDCVTIRPDARGRVYWESDRSFAYVFDPGSLKPEQKYEAAVSCIPLSAANKVKVKAGTYTFSTPGYTAVNAYITKITSDAIEAKVQFAFPMRLFNIDEYFSVAGADGKDAKLLSAGKSTAPDTIVIVWKNLKSKSYRITVAKNLPAADGVHTLSAPATFEVIVPDKVLHLSGVTASEGAGGTTIDVACTVSGAYKCSMDAGQARRQVQLNPEIPFRVTPTSHGFKLHGAFVPDRTYTLKVMAGLAAREGGVLGADYTTQVKIPKPAPRVSFAVRGHYLGRKGGVKVPLQVRLVDELAVAVERIPPENVAVWGFKEYNWWNYSETVEREKRVAVGAGDKSQLFWLDLADVLDAGEPGVYRVKASLAAKKKKKKTHSEEEGGGAGYEGDEGGYYDSGNRQKTDSVVVVISDLALVSKRSKDHVHAWVLNSVSGASVSGAEVKAVSHKNVPLGGCTTDADGYCSFTFKPVRDRKAAVLVAQKAGEWTFLDFDATTIGMEPFDVAGVSPRDNPYLATVYPERDIYRPGEKVNFAAVVREKGSYKAAALPVSVKVVNPRGKELMTLQGKTDAAGMTAFSFGTDASSPTGRYSMQLVSGEDEIASGSVMVETFVPERITVRATPSKTDFSLKDQLGGEIQADYLFGVPASGEPYKVICTAGEGGFAPKDFPGYSFGGRYTRGERSPVVEPDTDSGVLDDHGHVSFSCELKNLAEFRNKIDVSMNAEVAEAGGGRASRSVAKAAVHPFPFYIGLKPKTSRIEPGKKVEVQGVTVNPDGTARTAPARLSWQVYRMQYDYSRVYNPDSRRFEWTHAVQKLPWVEKRTVVPQNGKFAIDFTPEEYWYDYFLEVRDEGSNALGEISVAGWGWWWESARPESPETFKVKLDKNEADYGEKVKASVLLPFSGRILWTVEIDNVLRQSWQEAGGETAEWTFEVPRGHSSVYVSALLVRVHENYLVRRAFGVQRLGVRPSEHRLDLKVEAPERMHPGEDLKVVLQAKSKFSGTVAIVDEGILQVTRFKSPDVFRAIFADQALQVDTAETLGWVVPKTMDLAGGGEGGEAAQPTFVRLVAYWSGLKESDASGKLEVKFSVPAYNGKLRVMFSAADPQRLGSGEKFVTVTSNVVVSPTLPRFMSTGDEFEFPISLRNTTDGAKTAKLSVDLEGAALSAAIPASVDLPARASKTVWVPVKAGTAPGFIVVRMRESSNGEKYDETLRIPLKPDRPFLTEGVFEKVASGSFDLARFLADWSPYELTTRVVLSPVPAIARMSHMKHLLHYPYGCVEQTSSSLLPLVRLMPILPLIDKERSPSDLQNFVSAGVGRIISMQTPSGGFGYWPGAEDPQAWASHYATFVLLEAQAAGYMVPDSVIQAALRYAEKNARQTPFGYFVLAKGGKLSRSDAESLVTAAGKPGVASEDLLWFAGALQLGGKTDAAQKVLDAALKAAPQKTPARRLSHDFYSPLREKALRLYIAELVRPASPRNESMMMELVEALKNHSYYYSTQELAWGVLSLGLRVMNSKYAQSYEATLFSGTKKINAEKNEYGLTWALKSANKDGSPRMEIKADGAMYVYVENSGFKEKVTSFAAVNEGLSVKRRIVTLKGDPVSALRLRDSAVMEVTIDSTQRSALENSAVEVRVPPGVEIENPRLAGTIDPLALGQPKDQWHPDYVEVKDDSVQLFGTLRYGVQRYKVMLRVVTPGHFFMPPTSASVMYNPEIRGATEGGRVEVGQ